MTARQNSGLVYTTRHGGPLYSLGVHLSFQQIEEDNRALWGPHDTSAVLVREDGAIIAAAEEERFTRVKHCNTFPARSIEFCLRQANITLADVDVLAISTSEDTMKRMQLRSYFFDSVGATTPHAYVNNLFQKAFQTDVTSKLHFVDHHEAHAWSVFPVSGYDRALVIVLDGDGETKMTKDGFVRMSGLAAVGTKNGIEIIDWFPISQSLGHFYQNFIHLVGYHRFDEYKVMGLAPYGNPSALSIFDSLLTLLPSGRFRVHAITEVILEFLESAVEYQARRAGEPFSQWSKDFAAWIQDRTEKAILHLLEFYASKTKAKNLCIAGGVGHNCSANGRVYYSGLFENVYFQPVAHDAGTALGAALYGISKKIGHIARSPMKSLFLGTTVPVDPEPDLVRWQPLIKIRRCEKIECTTAKLIADGHVIGWVQGRSEYGPRALGARSILADPRPEENKERINKVVKRRESYRPFAPSVLEENVHEVFELSTRTTSASLAFMISTLNVKHEWRNQLKAVTHIDGSARVQVVSKADNQCFWSLLKEFHGLTGVPVLLNTSFNNNLEPIVDSINQAIACFLTTDLDYLVISDFIVEKGKPLSSSTLARFSVSLPRNRTLARNADGQHFIDCRSHPWFGQTPVPVSEGMFQLLSKTDASRSIGEMTISGEHDCRIVDELIKLWEYRAIIIAPITQ